MLTYLRGNLGWLADVASLVGLAITFVGFAVTIWNVRRTKRAAEEAKQAAREVVARLKSQLLVHELGAVLQFLREIDMACQSKNWSHAVHRCDDARIQVIRFSENLRISPEDRQVMSQAAKDISELLIYLQQKREKTPNRPLSRQRLTSLQTMIVGLGQLHAKIEMAIMEKS